MALSTHVHRAKSTHHHATFALFLQHRRRVAHRSSACNSVVVYEVPSNQHLRASLLHTTRVKATDKAHFPSLVLCATRPLNPFVFQDCTIRHQIGRALPSSPRTCLQPSPASFRRGHLHDEDSSRLDISGRPHSPDTHVVARHIAGEHPPAVMHTATPWRNQPRTAIVRTPGLGRPNHFTHSLQWQRDMRIPHSTKLINFISPPPVLP